MSIKVKPYRRIFYSAWKILKLIQKYQWFSGITAVYAWGNQTDLDLAANVDKTICGICISQNKLGNLRALDPKYTAPPVTFTPTTAPNPGMSTTTSKFGFFVYFHKNINSWKNIFNNLKLSW